MTVENNWIYSNLKDRYNDPLCDFKAHFNPRPFKIMPFYDAAKDAAYKIANTNDNLFVSYSGGYDSEFILVLLHELKIPVTPIIVSYSGNSIEIQYAYYMCRKLNITPIVIDISEGLLMNIFINKVVKPINGSGIGVASEFITLSYAKNHGGMLLTGEHIIDDEDNITKASLCEWDFYLQILAQPGEAAGLLLYTPEITYAIANEFDGSPVQDFKSRLFGLSFRPKLHPTYNPEVMSRYHQNKPGTPSHTYILGTKEKFLTFMNSWNSQ